LCACDSGSNILKWPSLIGYKINKYRFSLVKELPIFEYK
jgi:hypothetical protein